MPRGKSLLPFVVVAAIVAVPLGIGWLIQSNLAAARDCYLQEQVAEMIIEHMERNQGAWPKDWDDLAEAYEICQAGPRASWSTLAEIRQLCDVDFSADPVELVRTGVTEGTPPFQVVRLVSGKSRHWSGGEPNQLIYRYLKAAAERPDDYEYSAKPVPSERLARKTLLEKGATWELSRDGHVVSVNMGSHQGSPRFSDEDLQFVAAFSELQELILDNSPISDVGLAHLANLNKLQTLYISGTNISDTGLSCLNAMDDLETLTVVFCGITDDGLIHLLQLPSLKYLNLNYTNITDDGIESLCRITSLENILIGDTHISGEGASRLKAAFPEAEIYHSTRRTDEGHL